LRIIHIKIRVCNRIPVSDVHSGGTMCWRRKSIANFHRRNREREMGSNLNSESFREQASVNRNYPIADPKNRLPSEGQRRWNASPRAEDAASPLVIASSTKSSRVSIAGPSWRAAAWDNHARSTTPEPVLPTGRKACCFR